MGYWRSNCRTRLNWWWKILFLDMDDNEHARQSRKFQDRQVKRRKGKGKGKGGSKRTGKAYIGEEQTKDTEWWSEEDCAWWSKGKKKQERFFEGVTMAFRKVVFAPTNQKKVQAMNNTTCTRAEARIRKEKTRKVPILNQNFSASETPSEEGYGHTWESDDRCSSLSDNSSTSAAGWCGTGHSAWMAAVPLDLANHPTHVVLDLGCTRSMGSRAAIKKVTETYVVLRHYDRVFAVVKILSCLPTPRRRPCWESCIIHFPTTPPCSTRVDVLETGYVPTLFSHPQMKHLGMTIELDPKRDKITCPAFGLYSSPAEYSTMGHFGFGFDESCVPDKIAWAGSEQKSANPARTRELNEDDDDKPLVCPDNVTVSENEDDEPLVRPSSRTELIKEKRDSAA